jgi:hypothetical protein
MIIKKTWITKKYNKVGSINYLKSTHKWFGLFLFGIIPLYLENYETTYN